MSQRDELLTVPDDGPARVSPITEAVTLVEDDRGAGVVFINGLASFMWDAVDEIERSLAAVQLVNIDAASTAQVSTAFNVDASTLGRWQRAYRGHGLAGLMAIHENPPGPVGDDQTAAGATGQLW